MTQPLPGIDFEALDMQHGLPWGTTRAVAMTESNMNPRAVSPAGAQGLMQFMPGTARDMGLTDPFDPNASAQAGSRYLGQLMDRYGGNWTKALQAYNFGMGNIDKGRPLPAETQAYAPKVAGHRMSAIEQDIFAGAAPADLLEAELFGEQQLSAADQFETEVFGGKAQALEAELFGTPGRSEDVPLGSGEPGGPTGRDPDVPYAPAERPQGMDPDVPLPGTPDEYVPPTPVTGQEDIPLGMKLIPPSHRGAIESLVRGATTPVQADLQLLSAVLPDKTERHMFGETLLEKQKKGESSYQQRRGSDGVDAARLAGHIATSLPLAALPVGGHGMLANVLRGAATATANPVDDADTAEAVLKGKGKQAGIGAGLAAGTTVGMLAANRSMNTVRAVRNVLDAKKASKAKLTLEQVQKMAKQQIKENKAILNATKTTPKQAASAQEKIKEAQRTAIEAKKSYMQNLKRIAEAADAREARRIAKEKAALEAMGAKGAGKDMAKHAAKHTAGDAVKETGALNRYDEIGEELENILLQRARKTNR